MFSALLLIPILFFAPAPVPPPIALPRSRQGLVPGWYWDDRSRTRPGCLGSVQLVVAPDASMEGGPPSRPSWFWDYAGSCPPSVISCRAASVEEAVGQGSDPVGHEQAVKPSGRYAPFAVVSSGQLAAYRRGRIRASSPRLASWRMASSKFSPLWKHHKALPNTRRRIRFPGLVFVSWRDNPRERWKESFRFENFLPHALSGCSVFRRRKGLYREWRPKAGTPQGTPRRRGWCGSFDRTFPRPCPDPGRKTWEPEPGA